MAPDTIKLDLLTLREEWRKNPHYGCFWSSPDNDRGLRLTPTIEPGLLSVKMKIEREHSGFPGIAHGGIAFTIIDGLMGWFVMSHEGRAGFTTGAQTEYRGALKVGNEYIFKAMRDKDAETNAKSIHLVGTAADVNAPDKILFQMKAAFFLPDRKTAERVLGVPILTGGLFPE